MVFVLTMAVTLAAACQERPAATPRVTTTTVPGGAAFDASTAGAQTWGVALLPHGKVFAWTAQIMTVRQDVVVEEIRPVELPGNVELLAVRMTYVRRADGGPVANAAVMGSGCIETWPPPGMGRTFDPAGAFLRAGDQVSVNYYARGVRPGVAKVVGTAITYSVDGARFRQQFEDTTGELEVATGPDDPLLQGRTCGHVTPRWVAPTVDERVAPPAAAD